MRHSKHSDMKPNGTLARARRSAALVLLAGAGLGLGACEGDNLFRNPPVEETPGNGGEGAEPAPDSLAPTVTIVRPTDEVNVAAGDTLLVRVVVEDSVGIARVQVTGFSGQGDAQVPRYQTVTRALTTASDTVRADTIDLRVPAVGPVEAATISIVATVADLAGNVDADTVTITSTVIRGRSVALENPRDSLLDIVSDGRRVFVSNYSRNRVEVLPIGGTTVTSVRVGSKPWGLALSPNDDTLFVANSGGTNISVVDLAASTLAETDRIQTPNIRLFQVTFSRDSVVVVEGTDTSKIAALVPQAVSFRDFSDRPQFIAQMASGTLLYSTRPTSAARDGTIRRRDPATGNVEFFIDYAPASSRDEFAIVNAESAYLIKANPNRMGVVPRGDSVPIEGFVDVVRDSLVALGSPTQFVDVDLTQVGLSDTTFVAVSGDHRTVAFGEGATQNGRILMFQEAVGGTSSRVGDVEDLIGNTAERVIGLALNRDGSLGVARGQEAYFFDRALRLQGVTQTGAPSGGVAMHPEHTGSPANRFTFISGIDDNGTPFLDVVDTFNFFRRNRIFLREPITGALTVVRAAGTADLILYGVTARGILELPLTPADLR